MMQPTNNFLLTSSYQILDQAHCQHRQAYQDKNPLLTTKKP